MPILGDFKGLNGRNVLVVEDEYFLAIEMADAVKRAGGIALGPVPDVDRAMTIIVNTTVDAAVLDINLGGENSFPVASALRAKGVHVVFVAGYDDWFLPDEIDDIPVYRKPTDPDNVVRILSQPRQS